MKKGPRWLKLEFLAYQRVGLLKGREMGSLLMHAFISIIHIFLWDFCIFPFFFFFTLLFFSFYLYFLPLFPPLLFTTMAFYNICYDRNYRFYPLTAFGSLWASFQDCQLACQLPSHYHYTMLATPRLIPRQKWFCFVSYLSLFSILLSE